MTSGLSESPQGSVTTGMGWNSFPVQGVPCTMKVGLICMKILDLQRDPGREDAGHQTFPSSWSL